MGVRGVWGVWVGVGVGVSVGVGVCGCVGRVFTVISMVPSYGLLGHCHVCVKYNSSFGCYHFHVELLSYVISCFYLQCFLEH
jgi:hypothetical protein